jgi:hypothetical protein
MREGFQKHVDEQNRKYATQLSHAQQLCSWYRYGEVVGVYNGPVGGGVAPIGYVASYLPLIGVPIIIIAAAARIPGALLMLAAFPFVWGAWFGFCLWRFRDPKRQVWLYAFTEGFLLQNLMKEAATPVRWNQLTEITQVWTEAYHHDSEVYTPKLTGYELRSSDGQRHVFSREWWNVQDPYREVGQLLKHLSPRSVAEVFPNFPTIDELVARYAIPSTGLAY